MLFAEDDEMTRGFPLGLPHRGLGEGGPAGRERRDFAEQGNPQALCRGRERDQVGELARRVEDGWYRADSWTIILPKRHNSALGSV